MKIKLAAVAVVLGLGATEAMAQPGWYGGYSRYDADIPPHQVVRILHSAGLNPISRPVLVGPNYVVQAIDRNGQLQRVVVDAEFGDVLRVRPAERTLPPAAIGRPMRPTMPRDYDDDEVATLPPEPSTQWHGPRPRAGIPNARTAAVTPTTPLPRPRPAEAPTEPVVAKPEASAPPAPSEPAAAKPDVAEAPKPPAATPRVVLPGGPAARNERAIGAPVAESRSVETAPSYGIPPAQSLE